MFKQISMQDLHNQTRSGLGKNDLILDVRSSEEYADGHVPGSRNIPHAEVQKHTDELKQFEHVYVHCQMGGRAQRACQALEKQGLSNLVCVVNSGMGDWIKAGYPVEK